MLLKASEADNSIDQCKLTRYELQSLRCQQAVTTVSGHNPLGHNSPLLGINVSLCVGLDNEVFIRPTLLYVVRLYVVITAP